MSWQLQVRAKAEIERRKRKEIETPLTPKRTFTATYRDDPVGFVHDCFNWQEGEGPVFYQEDALAALPTQRRVCIRGPHGLGKTALTAWAVLWFATTRDLAEDDWKIPTTASAWRQLTKFLWPEIRKWSRRLRWDLIGRGPFRERFEMLELSLKLDSGEAFALASDNSELIEGAHASHLLYIFDESKAINAGTWDSAEGAFSTGDVYWLAVSTPGEPGGRFYDIQSRKPGYEDWWVRHVTLDETIRAGRVSQKWADDRKRQWGEGSAVYQNRVKGEFAAGDEDGVVPLAWIEAANERWEAWREAGKPGKLHRIGVDVARGGEDQTVFALRYKLDEDKKKRRKKKEAELIAGLDVIGELRRYAKADTMETADRVKGIVEAHGGIPVVDVIGLGAGVFDRLRQMLSSVRAFNAAEHTDQRDSSGELGFTNKRSAAWWTMRELLDPSKDSKIALPADDLLTGDLTAPKWKVMSGGKIQVESKEDLRLRLGRSTDSGDAVIQAYWDDEASMEAILEFYRRRALVTRPQS